MKKAFNLTLCLGTALLVSGCWKKSQEEKAHSAEHSAGQHSKAADNSNDTKDKEKVAENANDTADSDTVSTGKSEEQGRLDSEETGASTGASKGMLKKLASLFDKKDEKNKSSDMEQTTVASKTSDMEKTTVASKNSLANEDSMTM